MSTEHGYGVLYSPSTISPRSELTFEQLKDAGIRYIRFQWVDLTNTVRYRVIPMSHFSKILQSSRPSISVAKVSLGIIFLTLAPGFYPVGEWLYVPDLSTLRICHYAANHATCMGWFEEKVPVKDSNGNLTLKVEVCPRATLRRVVEEAKKTSGVEFLVGFETEFILLKSTAPIEAGNIHGWSASAGLPSGAVETKVLEEIAESLQDSGIELQMYHAEGAPGQYEVVTGPLPPLQAADALVHTRETIYNIASKHGLRATMAPRIYMDSCGSAAHAHISVHPSAPSTNVDPSKMSSFESSFLSGLLTHLPALAVLTLPLPASYKRMGDGIWSGGTYVCWGTDNREAPVRLCNASSPASRNFEFRLIDGTASPYIALAGILGAGNVGIRDRATLKIKDCAGILSAAEMGEKARRELGITTKMPLTWEDAKKTLSESDVLKEVLGKEFVEKYLSVNETMGNALTVGKTEEDALRLLVENY